MNESDPFRELGFAAAHLLHDVLGLVGRVQGRLAYAVDEARAGRVNSAELTRALADADTLHTMARDVIEALQGTELESESFNPVRVMESALREQHRQAGVVEIRAAHDAGLPLIQGRPSHFDRIVANLMRNALRHARSAVEVTLSAQVREGRDGVLLAVEDDGGGVDPELRERLFEPGVHGTHGGVGIGLASARWEAQRLGGTIALLDGEHLAGARFEVWLPAVQDGEDGFDASALGASLSGRTLLLIEDDETVRRVITRLLERMGATVRALDPARPTEEAWLDSIGRWRPDAILLDLNLGRWSGMELLGALRASAPHLAERVIILSGDAVGAGFVAHRRLTKPVGARELMEAVQEVVRATGTAEA